MKRTQKAIIVVDLEFDDEAMPAEEILLNAPTFIAGAIGQRLGPADPFFFRDPVLYMYVDDFDADREEKNDPFEGIEDDDVWPRRFP